MADITGIGSIFDFGSKILDKIFPDKTQADQAKAALAMAQVQGQLADEAATWDNLKAQIGVNQVEAANSNLFTSGWRPAVGWTCASSFAWQFVISPLLSFVLAACGHPISLPTLDFSAMSTILMGMLGLGAMRSYDKKQGTAS